MAVVSFDGTRSFEGAVLELREENGYHDSDFYCIYWNEDTGRVERREYATTRGGCGAAFATAVDATDEVKEKAHAFHVEARFEHLKALAERDAKTFAPGKTVALTRDYNSRKLKHKFSAGDSGTCFYYGRGFGETYAEKYGRTPPMRVGVEFADMSRSSTGATSCPTKRRCESGRSRSVAAHHWLGSSLRWRW